MLTHNFFTCDYFHIIGTTSILVTHKNVINHCFSLNLSKLYKPTFSFMETSIYQVQPFTNCLVPQSDFCIIYLSNPETPHEPLQNQSSGFSILGEWGARLRSSQNPPPGNIPLSRLSPTKSQSNPPPTESKFSSYISVKTSFLAVIIAPVLQNAVRIVNHSSTGSHHPVPYKISPLTKIFGSSPLGQRVEFVHPPPLNTIWNLENPAHITTNMVIKVNTCHHLLICRNLVH